MRAVIFFSILLAIMLSLMILPGCDEMTPPDDGKCHCSSPVCVENGGKKPLLKKCGCSEATCVCGVKKK